MARKLSRVSAEEMADLNKKLDEIFEDFKEEGGGISKSSLITFATEGGLLDRNLKEADVGMIFESTKLGKKTELNAVCFFEAVRKMAMTKEITFQELVQITTGQTPQRISVKADDISPAGSGAPDAGAEDPSDKAMALPEAEFATKMDMDKEAYSKLPGWKKIKLRKEKGLE